MSDASDAAAKTDLKRYLVSGREALIWKLDGPRLVEWLPGTRRGGRTGSRGRLRGPPENARSEFFATRCIRCPDSRRVAKTSDFTTERMQRSLARAAQREMTVPPSEAIARRRRGPAANHATIIAAREAAKIQNPVQPSSLCTAYM